MAPAQLRPLPAVISHFVKRGLVVGGRVARRELAGVPKVEVVGLFAGEGGGTVLGHDYPGQG
jgi:hypothetical protein